MTDAISTSTTFDAIYAAIGAVLIRSTGRRCWRKASIQGQPSGTYATVFVNPGEGLSIPIVERLAYDTEDAEGHIIKEIPWGNMYLECQVDFYRGETNDSALEAAVRFSNGLRLTEREWDLFPTIGLSGSVRILDISGMFRADIETRARAVFHFYANVSYPLPLNDIKLYDIQKQPVTLVVGVDSFQFTILNTGEIVQDG